MEISGKPQCCGEPSWAAANDRYIVDLFLWSFVRHRRGWCKKKSLNGDRLGFEQMTLRTFTLLLLATNVAATMAAAPAAAQTDYYNTDAGRPLTIEDAAAVERYAFELQLAPLRLDRAARGVYRWTVEPEIAYGIAPRTQVEIGLPLTYVDANRRSSGLAGVELSMLHSLNNETRLPALAVAGEVLLPVGGLAPDEAQFSAKGILTRTLRWARFHVNGQYTFGEKDDPTVISLEGSNPQAHAPSRWLAGIAMDRTFPLASTLIGAEVVAEKPRSDGADVEWSTALGIRRQLSPAFNVDAGIGKRLSGEKGWFFTFGVAKAFAIRSLMPAR
jgi:hypothetical protein